MQIIDKNISLLELKNMAEKMFGGLVKAVVDVEKEIMVVDGELHADEECLLLEHGSKQAHLLGVNIYPEVADDNWVEFDSMINLRPSQSNKSRGVDDPQMQERIRKIVNRLVTK